MGGLLWVLGWRCELQMVTMQWNAAGRLLGTCPPTLVDANVGVVLKVGAAALSGHGTMTGSLTSALLGAASVVACLKTATVLLTSTVLVTRVWKIHRGGSSGSGS